MSLRAFRLGLLGGLLAATALWLAWHARRDARRLGEARMAAAQRAAAAVGRALADGRSPAVALERAGRAAGGYQVRACMRTTGLTRLPRCADGAVLDSMRRDEAPRAFADGAVAPLKDADDWDVVGVVAVAPGGLDERRPAPWRADVTGPPAALALLAVLLWRWAGRTAERRRRTTLAAWAFLAPAVAHLAVFSFGPALGTLWLSFHRWNLLADARPWVGLGNYRALARDPLFWSTLRNTAVYVLYVPITMALALGLAVLLDRRRGGERLLRAVVFLPYVTSLVAVAIAWQWLFHADVGLINVVLGALRLPTPDWLGDPRTALLAIIAVTVWTQVGYQMVVFLAGLQGVPRGYLDAALVDGASPWQRFRHVTLPLLRPVVLFVLVTGIIGGFQVFTLVYLMTEGGPLHSTDVLVYRIYQAAWEFLRFGDASAMAVVLCGILLAATVLQFRLLGRRVDLG